MANIQASAVLAGGGNSAIAATRSEGHRLRPISRMKSAEEVLLQENTNRLRRNQDQSGWDAIIRDCRTPRWPSLVALLAWPVVIAALLYRAQPTGFRPVHGAVIIGFAYVAIRFAVACYRRERGLRAAIAREAPELAEKLRREAV